LSESSTYPDVESLEVDPVNPATIYAGTNDNIFKSTDGGNNWTPVNAGLPSYFYVYSLAIDPGTPGNLYAATYSHGVYKSTNGGASWAAINSGLPLSTTAGYVLSLAIDPATPTTLYAGTYDGVYKSTDSGGNWTAAGSGPPADTGLSLSYASVSSLAVDPCTPTTVYAGTDWGVYKSTNGGASWTYPALPLTQVSSLAIDPVTPTTLYAGATATLDYSGVYMSTDGGASWTAVDSGLPAQLSVISIAIDLATATLYIGTDQGGVYRSH
jgi:photosystem II stability/assembly factor-like uncharacterized protein